MSTTIWLKSGRRTAILIAFMLFFTVFAVIPMLDSGKVYAAGETGQVTVSALNVRSGAGTNYSIIGSLSKGKTFTVTGTAKDKAGVTWYQFKYGSKTAYVSSQYVNIKQPTVTSVSNTQGTVNDGPLNVRSGPGTSYSRIGSLAYGKTFAITGKAQDVSGVWWYQLSYSGKTAYVSSQYVTTKSTATSITTVTNTTGTVAIDSGVLYVRSGPGTSYAKIGSLAKGKTFAVTGQAKDSSGRWWYQLSYSGKTGYVTSQYVKTTTSSSGSTAGSSQQETLNKKGTVAIDSGVLNIRSGPGTNYSILGSLGKGQTVTVTGQTKDSSGKTWYTFSYSGRTGYLYGDYIKLSDIATESNGSTGESGSDTTYKPVTFQMGTTTADDGLNVRSGAGTGYSRLTVLPKGTHVTITGSAKDSGGKVWYKYAYSSSTTGYICSDYVTVKTVTSDSDFEAYLASQGFPESYKPGLRSLHAAHPHWVFKAAKVGYNWSDALAKESVVGTNLVSASSPVSYRSTASGSYNASTKTWTKFDGSWYAASQTVIAYYMDPRNFLSESGIYQFMTHTYDGNSQNASTVAAVINGSFMQTKNPGGGYSSYADLITAAGKNSGVNPNVLASMIIQEQGWSGSSLVSGTYSGYYGYYNFFNIGAYTTDTMNAVQRGLWYASGSGSYSRPWNTPYKSILGGAQFYSEGYVSNNQDSYYSKKFNVYNGYGKVGTHQYMTNVAGAASEGSIVKRAYASNSNYPVVFEIPVYNSMPANNCQLP